MPGPPPKPSDRRQNRGRRDLGVVETPAPKHPMPSGLCARAKESWNGYWSDVVSGVMRDSDLSLVNRWAHNLDRYHRLLAQADGEPVVHGSSGQPRTNPIYDLVYKIEASIKDDEKQLGIGPLNRLRLGLAIQEGARSLADLNADAEVGDDDDPRLHIVDGTALA